MLYLLAIIFHELSFLMLIALASVINQIKLKNDGSRVSLPTSCTLVTYSVVCALDCVWYIYLVYVSFHTYWTQISLEACLVIICITLMLIWKFRLAQLFFWKFCDPNHDFFEHAGEPEYTAVPTNPNEPKMKFFTT